MVRRLGILLLGTSLLGLLACVRLSDESSGTTAHPQDYHLQGSHCEAPAGKEGGATAICRQTRPCGGIDGRIIHCDDLD
jgi:hypothetical protein